MTAQPFLNRVPLLIVAVKLLKYVGNNVFQADSSRCYFYSFIHFLYLFIKVIMSKKVDKKDQCVCRCSQSSYAKRSISSLLLDLKSPSAEEDPLCEKFCKKQLDSKSFHIPVDLFPKLSMNVSMFSSDRTSAEENSPLSQKRARHEVSFKIMEMV